MKRVSQLGEDFDAPLPALVDTGASISAISADEARRLGLTVHRSAGRRRVIKLGKGWARSDGTAVLPEILLNGHKVRQVRLQVLEGLAKPLILGMDTLAKAGAIIDCALAEIAFKADAPSVFLLDDAVILDGPDTTTAAAYEFMYLDLRTMLKQGWTSRLGAGEEQEDAPSPAISPAGTGTPVIDDEVLRDVVSKHPGVFIKPDELPPRRGNWDFQIELKEGAEPVRKQYARFSQKEREAAWAEVQKLLKLGWIRQSASSWSSPLLFARNKKKDGSYRCVYDYRSVNRCTELHQGPLPRIPDLIAQASQGSVFTLMDISKAYNQLRMRAGHEKFTAFHTPWNLYESLTMMMGLMNAGPHFQAFINAVMAGDPSALPRYAENHRRREAGEAAYRRHATEHEGVPLENLGEFVLVYVDDIVVFSDNMEDHRRHVAKVLERLELYDLRVNEFSDFGVDKINFLGFEVGHRATRILESRAKAIREWPVPTTPSEVHTFTGLANYYREHVPQFALHSSRLTPLQNKKLPFVWGADQQYAFEAIRDAIARRIELYSPRADRPYVLVVDGSIYAVGGVLFQEDEHGNLRTVAFFSRQTRGAESRYGQYAIEFLALVASVQHFRVYLDGCCGLTIYTDHKPLQTGQIFDVSQPHHRNHRIARWVEKLATVRADLRHHSATEATAKVVDAFSRRPDYVRATKRDLEAWLEDIKAAYARDRPQPEEFMAVLTLNETDSTATCRLHAERDFVERIRAGFVGADEQQLETQGYVQDADGLWRLHGRVVVPQDADLREDIVRMHHENGHVGVKATCRLIRRTFIWPRMQDDVARLIKQCSICQRIKPRNWKRKGAAFPLPIATKCWEDVEVDFVPQLPPSGEGGFTRIAVVLDRFSKEARFVPCHDTMTAVEFAQLYIDHIWRLRGAPRILRTDRDRLFIAKAWEHFVATVKIRQHFAAPLNHQAIGGVERLNQTAEKLLRAYVAQNPSDWAKYIGVVEFVYNSTPLDAMGISPFEIALGWRPRAGIVAEAVPGPAATVGEAHDQRRAVHEWVRERLLEAQDEAFRENERPDFAPRVGDRVFLSAEGVAAARIGTEGPADKRLTPRWLGPFVVLKAEEGARAVDIELPLKWRVENPIALSRLKACDDTGLPPVEVAYDEAGEPYVIAEVEHVLEGSHIVGPRKKWIGCGVRFVGYGEDMDREYVGAEFEQLVRDAPLVIGDYARLHPELKLSRALAQVVSKAQRLEKE